MHVACKPIPVETTAVDKLISGGLTLVRGWSFRETTGGAPAVFELVDGSGPNGALLATFHIPSGLSTDIAIPGSGVAAFAGLFLNMISGSVRGSVWTSEATLLDGFAFTDGPVAIPGGAT